MARFPVLELVSTRPSSAGGSTTGQEGDSRLVIGDRVEGVSVRIGPDCDIETVEADEMEVAGSATVGEKQ